MDMRCGLSQIGDLGNKQNLSIVCESFQLQFTLNQDLLNVQNKLDGRLLKLVADLLGLIFAINGEAILLGFVGAK